jgi:hypothetical protein
MTPTVIARWMMTLILAGGAMASFVLDWAPNHLLNPEWHAHARFHGALLLFFLAGVSATGIWLLWRKSAEPELAIKVAALISLSYWTPLFYVPLFLPSASRWAGAPGAEPRISSQIVYPNLLVAAGFLAVTAVSVWITRRRPLPRTI